MALTLTEAAKYTTNKVKKGVLTIIAKDSVVMSKLPFQDLTGNALQYLRENTLPTGAFYSPGEVWMESTGDVTQKTVALTILGGDADVDNFLRKTRSNYTDLKAETVSKKSKAIRHTFLNSFYYGDSATVVNEFDGLHKILADSAFSGQLLSSGSGTTPGVITAANMDALMDLILDGSPDCIMTTRAARRRIRAYLRSQANVDVNLSDYGTANSKQRLGWAEIPIEYDDFLSSVEAISGGAYSAKTGGTASSIFTMRFGEEDVCGLQNGGLEIIPLGQLQSKDAERVRIRWYVTMTVFRPISIARLDGNSTAAAMTA